MPETRSPPPFVPRDPDIVSEGPAAGGGVFEKTYGDDRELAEAQDLVE
ncbi:MAG: hypothetical protein ACM3NO_06210 [Deltaproteobacteria bacterium]